MNKLNNSANWERIGYRRDGIRWYNASLKLAICNFDNGKNYSIQYKNFVDLLEGSVAKEIFEDIEANKKLSVKNQKILQATMDSCDISLIQNFSNENNFSANDLIYLAKEMKKQEIEIAKKITLQKIR